MDDGRLDPEQQKIIDEMRHFAYPHAAQVMNERPIPLARRRPNVYDQATGEWLRSKTFRCTCCLVLALPLIIVFSTTIGGVIIVLLTMIGMGETAKWLVDMGR